MRSVTSMPLTPGRCRSHSTTSGSSWRTSRSASSPVSASPTTSMSVSPDRIIFIPVRTCAWSSTRRPRRVIHVKPPVMMLRWPSLAASRDVAMGAGD
ncbi:hypothetical protein G6F65_010843 [Rhizopus arrhizus]|nr:hypothetical protein G6F65_010843 [Rhizopus arrhizus]